MSITKRDTYYSGMLRTDVSVALKSKNIFLLRKMKEVGKRLKDEKFYLLQKRKILDLIGTCSLSLKNIFRFLGRPFHESHIYDLNKNNK